MSTQLIVDENNESNQNVIDLVVKNNTDDNNNKNANSTAMAHHKSSKTSTLAYSGLANLTNPSSIMNQLTSFDQNQSDYNYQQLITKIQSLITFTGNRIKQKLANEQYKQLISYKDDLLKTQQQFIRIREERNQQYLKYKIMEEKQKKQLVFNQEMKKSVEMIKKYEELKVGLKKIIEDEKQLKLEINYMKKKVIKVKIEADALDKEIQQINKQNIQGTKMDMNMNMNINNGNIHNSVTNNNNSNIPNKIMNNNNHNKQNNTMNIDYTNKNKASKTPHLNHMNSINKQKLQTQFFKQIINKCDSKQPIQLPQHQRVQRMQKSIQQRLRIKIQNIKDYIEHIPLELNFIQQKLLEELENSNNKGKNKESSNQEIKEEQKIDRYSEQDTQNQQQQQQQNYSVNSNSKNRCNNTTQIQFVITNNNNNNYNNKNNNNHNNKIKLPQINKVNNKQPIKPIKYNLSESLQQILNDQQVKRYLYGLLFL